MNWYALSVKPQAERTVEAALTQKSYETYVPIVTSERRWSDRIKRVETALLPGYVFCRFDGERRLPVLTTPGVREIVGFGRAAAPVSDDELSALRRVIESGLRLEACEYLERGDRVEVTGGPLEGVRGLLLEVKGQWRVVVSVELLQRSVAVEMDRDRIRRIESKLSMTAGGKQ
ncbi:MAG: UpxY family transcription antiterminator [Bryobacteraceae bacterium]|nr:UpxY family transcription antiterminator [Bryobacteraceae bacterium]